VTSEIQNEKLAKDIGLGTLDSETDDTSDDFNSSKAEGINEIHLELLNNMGSNCRIFNL
jgi:hypothetical protein